MTEGIIRELLMDFQALSAERERQKARGLNDYSLIGSMLKASDEVRLHTRFIYSLLDPDGKHYQGALFLRLFLETAGLTGIVDPESARVYKEYSDPGKLKGQIDLLITDGEGWIAIENKINALDGKRQLFKYANYLQDEAGKVEDQGEKPEPHDSICMVYLNKYGGRPADYSLAGYSIDDAENLLFRTQRGEGGNQIRVPVSAYRSVTYQHHIKAWLSRCLAEVGNIANLATAISEYEIIRQRICKEYRSRIMNIESVFLNDDRTFDQKKYEAAIKLINELPKLQAQWLDEAMRADFQQLLERQCKDLIKLDAKKLPMLKDRIYRAGDAERFFATKRRATNKGVFYLARLGKQDCVLGLLFGSEWLHAGVLPVKKNGECLELDLERRAEWLNGSLKEMSQEVKSNGNIQKPFPGLISYAKDLRAHAPELRDLDRSGFGYAIREFIHRLSDVDKTTTAGDDKA